MLVGYACVAACDTPPLLAHAKAFSLSGNGQFSVAFKDYARGAVHK